MCPSLVKLRTISGVHHNKNTKNNELQKKITIFEIRFIINVLAKLQFSLIN